MDVLVGSTRESLSGLSLSRVGVEFTSTRPSGPPASPLRGYGAAWRCWNARPAVVRGRWVGINELSQHPARRLDGTLSAPGRGTRIGQP